MPHASWKPRVLNPRNHPGSTWQEILEEPDWAVGHGHNHRIGRKNNQNRIAGLTAEAHDPAADLQDGEKAKGSLTKHTKKPGFKNFRDVVEEDEDISLEHRQHLSVGWRYVLDATEDGIKYDQEWPANVQRKEKEKQQQEQEQAKEDDKQNGSKKRDEDNKQRNEPDNSKSDQNGDTNVDSATQEQESMSAEVKALLDSLRDEAEYVATLQENDGKRSSPVKNERNMDISIDEADQFTPDSWLPRSADLIRLTGKHPLNAEAHLSHLFEAGMITPNELHYVRNHGPVPRLAWEEHKIDIHYGKLVLSMDDLKSKFDPINIPVALACDGNRRKELNMLRRSAGFNWGSGAVSCAYWKGALLHDVLVAAGLPDVVPEHDKRRYWVNFSGADELSEGTYETCIPLQYAMDATNDVLLAYEMNDVPLPPDHGYPVRLMIPGFVGGRCVKWLRHIWITEKENKTYYHIWDNRVLPSFVHEKGSKLAEALFEHPDTACNEQNLNSVIVKPAHGEKIPLTDIHAGTTYRVAGYAYDGGGHEVQRVEISLDDGEKWLYCIRRFPDRPIRHGKKFWTWLHWHIDVPIVDLLKSKGITVRCFNVFKNTQPQEPSWNVMGMMNNCWYVVKSEIDQDKYNPVPSIIFRHPVEPGTGDGGWMKPSVENQLANVKKEAGTPQKQFTRSEVEKHDSEDDCWIVVDGKVYDATSVLSWHPGGKAAVTNHAGRVHQETSDEFASIHDDYAYEQLKKCVLGVLTDKAKDYVKQTAEKAARDKQQSDAKDERMGLQKHRWVPVKLIDRQSLSEDTRSYTFQLPEDKPVLGIGTCQHIQLGFHLKDKMLVRSYTPTLPLMPPTNAKKHRRNGSTKDSRDSQADVTDGHGTFELTVKTYFPNEQQPGGAMSNILDCLPLGEEIEIRGPTGEIVYNGNGAFDIEGEAMKFKRVSLVLGGSGITPGYSLIAGVLLSQDDEMQLRIVDANKSEQDILLREELDGFEKKSKGQMKVTHILSHPSDDWNGLKGHVDAEVLKKSLFEPSKDSAVFLCGPPGMIQKAAVPALTDWGYKEGFNMFGF